TLLTIWRKISPTGIVFSPLNSVGYTANDPTTENMRGAPRDSPTLVRALIDSLCSFQLIAIPLHGIVRLANHLPLPNHGIVQFVGPGNIPIQRLVIGLKSCFFTKFAQFKNGLCASTSERRLQVDPRTIQLTRRSCVFSWLTSKAH